MVVDEVEEEKQGGGESVGEEGRRMEREVVDKRRRRSQRLETRETDGAEEGGRRWKISWRSSSQRMISITLGDGLPSSSRHHTPFSFSDSKWEETEMMDSLIGVDEERQRKRRPQSSFPCFCGTLWTFILPRGLHRMFFLN